MRRFGRGPVSLRDERPANWNEDDEARYRSARERWQLWVAFWGLGALGAALGFGTQTLGTSVGLWILAALLAVPLGVWTGPTLPDLVRRNEDARKNGRIGRGVGLVLSLVGTLVWFGALNWINAVFDFAPRRSVSFRVVSASNGQTRGGPLHRVVLEANGQDVLLQSGGVRFSGLKVGQKVQLQVGRGLFRTEWVDGNQGRL